MFITNNHGGVSMSLMGLDIGTTGCKCAIFDEAGNRLAASYREYALEQPAPGHYELNPEHVWQSVQHVIREAASQVSDAIRALSISSLGEAVVPVNRNGETLSNAILYMDVRGIEEAQRLEGRIGSERTMALTGVPLHAMFTLPKLMWIKKHQPELYRQTWKFMPFGDFIAFKLSGACVTSYSLASRTMALDIAAKAWAPEMFEAAALRDGLLPDLVPSGRTIGQVRRNLAESLGLGTEPLVVAGGHDQACAALGAGILDDLQAIDGSGTVACITPTYSSPVLHPRMLEYQFNCAPHVVEGRYVTYAFNFTGGSLLKWYRDQFGSRGEAEAHNRGMSFYDYMNATATADPAGLIVVPHFAGSGTPAMDPQAKGVIHGLTLNTGPSQLYRALMEGVTYEMRVNMECLEEAGICIETLRAVGGGAKSDLWLQIKADIMNRPIEKLNVSEAGTLGTIMLAGKATGAYASFEEAAELLVKPVKTFVPTEPNRGRYDELFAKYKRLSEALAELNRG